MKLFPPLAMANADFLFYFILFFLRREGGGAGMSSKARLLQPLSDRQIQLWVWGRNPQKVFCDFTLKLRKMVIKWNRKIVLT